MENNPLTENNYTARPPLLPAGKTQVLGIDYNIAGLLCYVPFGFIAALVFLFTEPKESKFVRFHALQSLLLGAALIALSMILSFVTGFIGAIPGLGWIVALLMIPLSLVVCVGTLVLAVWLIIKAYQHEMWQIPIIGPYAERWVSN